MDMPTAFRIAELLKVCKALVKVEASEGAIIERRISLAHACGHSMWDLPTDMRTPLDILVRNAAEDAAKETLQREVALLLNQTSAELNQLGLTFTSVEIDQLRAEVAKEKREAEEHAASQRAMIAKERA